MDRNLMYTEILVPIGVLGTIAIGLVLFVKTLTDYYLKKKMVEKGIIGKDATELLKNQVGSYLSSLKWGLIILFGGLGLILLDIIPYEFGSPLPFGVFAVSVSLGFLLYYLIVKRSTEQNQSFT